MLLIHCYFFGDRTRNLRLRSQLVSLLGSAVVKPIRVKESNCTILWWVALRPCGGHKNLGLFWKQKKDNIIFFRPWMCYIKNLKHGDFLVKTVLTTRLLDFIHEILLRKISNCFWEKQTTLFLLKKGEEGLVITLGIYRLVLALHCFKFCNSKNNKYHKNKQPKL